jgi:uncharacterized protein YbjT (DUF2867 family)
MILITGAGGKTGKAIIKALSKIENVCAFVHREEHVPVLKALGAEKAIVGDMRDGSSIRSAIDGVRAVYHICPNMNPDEVEIGRLMLDEAKRAGVGHVLHHSVLHPQTEKMKHHWGKLRVEEMIFESGIPFTILQPAPYMQNLLANWKSILEDGILRLPYSVHAKFSFLDLEDLAEAAKTVLTKPDHRNAVYELAGTPPTSHLDVAEILSGVLNREVRAEKEDVGEWQLRTSSALAKDARSSQFDEYVIENLVRMFEYYDQWGLAGNPNVLTWILKREPTSLETFIKRTVNETDAAN